jgi:hypothetical protein
VQISVRSCSDRRNISEMFHSFFLLSVFCCQRADYSSQPTLCH